MSNKLELKKIIYKLFEQVLNVEIFQIFENKNISSRATVSLK